MMVPSPRVLLVVICTLMSAESFLPPYSSVRLPKQRTFPFLSVSNSLSKPTTLLRVAASATADTSTSNATSEEVIAEQAITKAGSKGALVELDGMPSDLILMALLEQHLPRYTVAFGKKGSSKYALWRTMTREIPELMGYEVDMLRQMHALYLKNNLSAATPNVLPLLDEYDFEASGGLSGRVYGIPGIADGANIVTTPISSIQTVSLGYVKTDDGEVAYELGVPARETYSNSRLQETTNMVVKGVGSNLPVSATDEDPDTMILRLGFLSASVLGGAAAIDLLSHHLTLNVFWV